MPDVFGVLRKDHEEVKAMLDRLEQGPKNTGGAVPAQLQERKRLVDELIIEQTKHEAAEQQYFWPAVRELGPEGDRVANEAIEQEVAGERVLDKLDKLGPDESAQFEDLLTVFASAARSHIGFEESRAWPMLRAAISAERSAELGDKIMAAKKTAPTRPHPATPPTQGAQKTAGPLAGAADRLRDALTGRGKHR
jgi:hemerythrin-like domain-containing protein